ncbi:MAG: YceI family protein [Chitinophagales bacterium]|nr:YceI family protein [Chitinophagales bacterium]
MLNNLKSPSQNVMAMLQRSKKTVLILVMLSTFALMAFTVNKIHTDTYTVDSKQSSLEWFAEKLTGKHNGTIMLSGGEFKNDHGSFTGSIEIEMSSIANTDLTDAKSKEKLEGHLKSADFFDVATYPKSKFVITAITPATNSTTGEVTHTIKGNLTIKDKTNEISFGAIITMLPGKINLTGTAIVDRSKFDIKYGSNTFYPNIGDKMIYDEFKLKFNVVAVKQ